MEEILDGQARNIEARLREHGVASPIETNGYWFRFSHNGLCIKFCAQHNYNGSGRFVGEMYRTGLSEDEVLAMKSSFANESSVVIPEPGKWEQDVRKYNHRIISIPGFLDNIIPELFELVNLPLEDYIAQRLSDSQQIYKAIGKPINQIISTL